MVNSLRLSISADKINLPFTCEAKFAIDDETLQHFYNLLVNFI